MKPAAGEWGGGYKKKLQPPKSLQSVTVSDRSWLFMRLLNPTGLASSLSPDETRPGTHGQVCGNVIACGPNVFEAETASCCQARPVPSQGDEEKKPVDFGLLPRWIRHLLKRVSEHKSPTVLLLLQESALKLWFR